MAFDAKQEIADRLTHLDDQLKQAKAKESKDAADNAAAVAELEDEIAGWNDLLADDKKSTAKKTAAKAGK